MSARERSIEVTAEDAAALAAKAFSSPTSSAGTRPTITINTPSSSSSASVKKRISNLIKLRTPKTNKTSPSSQQSTPTVGVSTTTGSTRTTINNNASSSRDVCDGDTTASEILARPYYAPSLQIISSTTNDVDNFSFNSESMGQTPTPTVCSLDTVKASNRQQQVPQQQQMGEENANKNKSPWKKLKQFIGIPQSTSTAGRKQLGEIDPGEDSPPIPRTHSKSEDFRNNDNGEPSSVTSPPSRRRIASMDFPSKAQFRNKQQKQSSKQVVVKQERQTMLDDALRGRLDGMDYLSLGPANLISLERQPSGSKSDASCTPWEPAPSFSFAGRSTHYSTKQMVTDMMWNATAGRKSPEIVLEGFFRDDRWIVTLDVPPPREQQYANWNSTAAPATTTATNSCTVVDVDDASNYLFCSGENHQSPERCNYSPEQLPLMQLTDEEEHSHSTTEEIIPRHKLWGSMWGAENKPPPKPSLMSSVEDVDQSGENILEMAASCSVPIDVDEDTFMISNALHLQAVHDLASVPLQHGRFDEAMLIFNKLLRGIQIQEEDPLRHLEGVTLHNMTVILMWQDKYEEALESIGKAIQARLQFLPDKHPDIAVSLVRQGYAYFAVEKFDLAEASFLAAGDIFVDGNICKAKVLSNLGVARYQRGDDTGALKNFTDALEIQRMWLQGAVRREANVFGAAVILGNMGKIHIKRGDYDLAVSVYEEALLLQTTIFRADDDTVLACLVSLALAWAFNAQPQKAVQILSGVLRSQIKRFGPGTPITVETTGTIGFLHFGLGNYEDALKCCAPVLKWQKANLDAGHPALRKTKDIMKRIKKSVQAVWV
ncbi:repeat-containing protein [Seminavis robusta]|uniref:Repeat-containing protein n=1 Tax=Seminavis robusta TaxID=568900 RepID=A0A9N8DTS2_9STRA|nr:repeat-containing protein [Seminavis robusta]|eukprot:Sro273_g105140.1 repeat-containing protein (828) ;mRNA; r:37987-40549